MVRFCIRANEDGEILNAKSIVRMLNNNENDLELLISKSYIFEDNEKKRHEIIMEK